MLTQTQINQLDWRKMADLIPAVIQNALSGKVLMLGYMNPAALEQTLATGKVTFFSRRHQRLWQKGERSGNSLSLVNISLDCDNDSLLVLANPAGPTCHTGSESCFSDADSDLSFLNQLEQVIASRKNAPSDCSYTASLFASGTKRIAQKVGEEGVETALAALVNDKHELSNEAADLLYHLLVLLQDQGLSLADIVGILRQRHQ